MTVLPVLVLLVLLVLALAVLVAVLLVRSGRRARACDLAVLAAVGRVGGADPGADGVSEGRPEPDWQSVVDAVRSRLRAARVVLRLDGRTVVAGGSRRADPPAALIAPVGAPPRGVLEVHAPRPPVLHRLRRALGRGYATRPPDEERALLAAVATAIGVAVENDRLRARLRSDPHHDPATGLLSRAGFLAAAAALRPDGPRAVAVVEVGLLRQVVETLGHAGADRAVTLAAARVDAACRDPGDAGLPARLGGDTFAVVLDATGSDGALGPARALADRLARVHLVDGLPFRPAVAVGVDLATGLPARSGPADARTSLLLDRADVARRAARADDPVRCFDDGLGERADRRVEVVRGFGSAAGREGLSVHFQPLVSLDTGAVLGVEALARWQHPELGLLLPDEFVPVLEASGQVAGLTTLVLDASLHAARGWLDAGLRLGVAVNVPVAQLDDPAFPDAVAAALAHHRVPVGLLTLELTESGVSGERAAALPVLRRLRGLGCRLSLDDFGTGQSSLAHLRGLPVDQIKIDKSFVLGMDRDPDDAALVRAIVGLGHTLGLTVVAEGVERGDVRATLAAMGCDVAQGFGVSRGLSPEDLRAWLDAREVRPDPAGSGGPRTLIA